MDNPFGFIWVLFQTFLALAFVCGLAYVIFRVLLPRINSTNFTVGTNNMVRVVDRIDLEARKNLYVVEVAEQWLLIAVSENGVQLVSELDAQAAKKLEQDILQNRQTANKNAIGATFADKLSEVMNRGKGGKK